MLKSNISEVYSHKYTKIKINSDDDLPYLLSRFLIKLIIFIMKCF